MNLLVIQIASYNGSSGYTGSLNEFAVACFAAGTFCLLIAAYWSGQPRCQS